MSSMIAHTLVSFRDTDYMWDTENHSTSLKRNVNTMGEVTFRTISDGSDDRIGQVYRKL